MGWVPLGEDSLENVFLCASECVHQLEYIWGMCMCAKVCMHH